jgi:hypothetical protein
MRSLRTEIKQSLAGQKRTAHIASTEQIKGSTLPSSAVLMELIVPSLFPPKPGDSRTFVFFFSKASPRT